MIAEALKQYKYNPNRPLHTISDLTVYQAENKENGHLYTLKFMKRPPSELLVYINKLKGLHTEYTIRINEVIFEAEANQLLIVQ